MTTALMPTPTRAIRTKTATARSVQARLQRLQESFDAKIDRAVAEYLEGVRDVGEELVREEPIVTTEVPEAAVPA